MTSYLRFRFTGPRVPIRAVDNCMKGNAYHRVNATKPYSLDLRWTIVRASDEKCGSQRALAVLFDVSRSFVETLQQVVTKDPMRPTGGLAGGHRVPALPHGGRSVRALVLVCFTFGLVCFTPVEAS